MSTENFVASKHVHQVIPLQHAAMNSCSRLASQRENVAKELIRTRRQNSTRDSNSCTRRSYM